MVSKINIMVKLNFILKNLTSIFEIFKKPVFPHLESFLISAFHKHIHLSNPENLSLKSGLSIL